MLGSNVTVIGPAYYIRKKGRLNVLAMRFYKVYINSILAVLTT